ncbi:nucleotidyltransferase family protein [Streptomyces sp. TP-A0874]|uniref:nucleotidyltransferase family protein n=1 Tax=Streptomyces sp. TP-A0874 TaxID=549819 RepID=UPI00085318EF|nr:nucleotidyltransferase family protein [Streptomyces sp. TP-A0874]
MSDSRPDGPAPRVAGVLLAAGGGSRLGGHPKALLSHRGRPLVEHAALALREGGCAPVYVVLGAAAERVRERARLPGCLLVDNPAWQEGMGTSLRAGLAAAADGGARAVLVTLVDQPGVGAAAVARVAAEYRSPSSLVAARYGEHRGHPVLFGADHWPEVARGAVGDQGARGYLRSQATRLRLVDCSDVAAADDIDTPADLTLLAPPNSH